MDKAEAKERLRILDRVEEILQAFKHLKQKNDDCEESHYVSVEDQLAEIDQRISEAEKEYPVEYPANKQYKATLIRWREHVEAAQSQWEWRLSPELYALKHRANLLTHRRRIERDYEELIDDRGLIHALKASDHLDKATFEYDALQIVLRYSQELHSFFEDFDGIP